MGSGDERSDDEESSEVVIVQTTEWQPVLSGSTSRVPPALSPMGPIAPSGDGNSDCQEQDVRMELDPISIDCEAEFMQFSLTNEQKRYFASIVACMLPKSAEDVEFSIFYFEKFCKFLEVATFEFEPLLRACRIDPMPFV